MSTTNPYETAFEMQRAMIEGSRTVAESGVEFSQTATGAMVESLDATRSAQESGVEFSRRAAHAYLDALERAGMAQGIPDAREAVDEGHDAVGQYHADAWEAFEEGLSELERSTEELSEAQLEAIGDSFTAALEAHDDAEAAVEEAVESVEEIADEA